MADTALRVLLSATLLGLASCPASAAPAAIQIDRDIAGAATRHAGVRPELSDSWKGQIDLVGLGEVRGEQEVLGALREQVTIAGPMQRLVRLAVDRSGAIVGCEPFLNQDGAPTAPARDELSTALCRSAVANLRYEPLKGFIAPGPKSYLTLEFTLARPLALARPVAFATGADRIAVTVTRTDFPKGEAAGCVPSAMLYDGPTMSAICKLWSGTMRSRQWRASDGRRIEPSERATIYLARAQDHASAPLELRMRRIGGALANAPVFEETPEPAAPLSSADGRLVLPIASDDYPAAALRNAISGSVRIEIFPAADGRIATCRPIVSSGVSELDNAACKLALRRGRWFLAEGTDAQAHAARPGRLNVRWEMGD